MKDEGQTTDAHVLIKWRRQADGGGLLGAYVKSVLKLLITSSGGTFNGCRSGAPGCRYVRDHVGAVVRAQKVLGLEPLKQKQLNI